MWTFDTVYSAEPSLPGDATRKTFLGLDRGVPSDVTGTPLQSPAKFAAQAAATMFATLPPVTVGASKIAK